MGGWGCGEAARWSAPPPPPSGATSCFSMLCRRFRKVSLKAILGMRGKDGRSEQVLLHIAPTLSPSKYAGRGWGRGDQLHLTLCSHCPIAFSRCSRARPPSRHFPRRLNPLTAPLPLPPPHPPHPHTHYHATLPSTPQRPCRRLHPGWPHRRLSLHARKTTSLSSPISRHPNLAAAP